VSLFEYVGIAFSLVFSFTAMRLVSGLPHAVDRERRYWVHLSQVAVAILVTAGLFWSFWSFRDVEWTYPRFILALANPSLAYFIACTLVPESPSSVESWRAYYYTIRKKFFVGVLLWGAVVALVGTVVLGRPLSHPTRVFQVITIALALLGAATGDSRVHSGIAVFWLCAVIAGTFVVFAGPMDP
jgi:hypothetical protein